MPQPPSTSLLTRYVLENPWPLAVAIAAVAAVLIWIGAREGLWRRVRVGGAMGFVALGLVLIGWFVETPGETGERITRQFVDAVVAEDVNAATALLVAEGGTFNSVSPNHPGVDLDEIGDRVREFVGDYDIESNRITMLDGYGESSDRAAVHLACITEIDRGYGPAVTQWVFRVERQSDGAWRITRITWVSMNSRPPPDRY